MAITPVTLDGDVSTLLPGVEFDPRRIQAVLETNVPPGELLVDTSPDGQVFLGAGAVSIAADGTFEIDLLPTNAAALNWGNLQYRLTFTFTDLATRKGGQRATTGWFDITESMNVRDLVERDYLPPTARSQAVAELQGIIDGAVDEVRDEVAADVAAAQAARAGAEAAQGVSTSEANRAKAEADRARDISNIEVSDDVMTAVAEDPESAFGASLKTTLVTKEASPRGGQRALLERKPTLTIDQVWPNGIADHRIVWADGATMYAVGTDTVLRKTTTAGATWERKYYPGGLGHLADTGLFFKTAAGTLVTTYAPFDLGPRKIIRSTDDGVTWTDVVAAQTSVGYLGPTSICQDPVTGYIYLTEYVTVSAATKATWKIIRSTDDGATWTTFHEFQRDATTYPDAVRHGHSIQWDHVSQRVWFLCGDGEQAAGLYRLNAAGNGIEPVVIRSQLPAGVSAGAVGVMFFPDYIAWGNDQFADSGVIRLARSELATSPLPSVNPAPAKLPVEVTAIVQATSFYTARTKADGSEWLMNVSNENGSGGRLDNAMHIYRVADNGAEVDEVLTLPASRDDASFGWFYPAGGRVFWDGPVWWASAGEPSPIMPHTGSINGYQFQARLAWGGQALVRPDAVVRRPHYEPVTVASGNINLGPSEAKGIGVTQAPARATRLYILEVTAGKFSGDGVMYVDVFDETGGARLKDEAGVDMNWQHRSRKAALNEASSPWLVRSLPLSPGRAITLRARNGVGGGQSVEGAVSVTYAWGF